jgi:serine/threonine protein kinase
MFPQIFGKYVLERELASGGMARVYLATLRGAVGFEKRLVVKQIRPELALDEAFVRRFVEEAKIAVELSHPNIVPVYELGVEQGIYYIAMELCEGLTLTEILMETGPLDPAEGAHVGIEICRALDYAHRRGGIVHRDVTPRNVLLDEEGAVRLIDFGIAAPVTGARAHLPQEVFGSPGHMPPEQIRGERLTPATDVFAVGALLIEAWTGRPPFRRGSFEASAAALKEPLPALGVEHPELSSVAEVVAQAVALNALERPQEAEALARKLRDFSRQFDSGDVAKRLGQRVHRARRQLRSSVPWLPGDSSGPLTPAASPRALLSSRPPAHGPRTPVTPPMPSPATPPGAVPITRTFAAREDLVEWTRKIASIPPLASEPDTELAASPSLPPPLSAASELDEPTTRALSRPKTPIPVASRRFSWAAAVAGAAGLGLAALLSWSGRGPSSATGSASPVVESLRRAPLAAAPPAGAASSTPPVAPPSALASLRMAPAPLAALSASLSAPSHSSPAAARSPVPGSGGAAATDLVSASLKLTADPPASVTIVGPHVSETLVTPVRALKLAPGAYAVTFRSATFAEPVAARIELAAGASRSIHADFRAAVPTVVVR